MTAYAGDNSDAAALASINPPLAGNSPLLTALLEASGDCIKVLNLDGHLLFMSEGGREAMEVDDFSAIQGCAWPDFWKDRGNALAQAALVTARGGASAHFLGIADTFKGNEKYWDVRVLPILGPDGKPTHLLSISKDISEQKRAELQARDSDMRVKLALSAAQMGVWGCGIVDGLFVDLTGDERTATLLGGMPGDYQEFVSRIAPVDRLALAEAGARALDPAGDGVLDAEYRIMAAADRPQRWIHARGQVQDTPDGKRLIGTVRDISQSKDGELRQQVLSGELQHRIKNTLAMVTAIATQTLGGVDIEDRRVAFTSRIEALAHAHDILTARTWVSAPIRTVVDGAVAPHASRPGRFVIHGPDIELNARQSLSMALAIHELSTNAAKYGAMSVPGGSVNISWGIDDAGPDLAPVFHFTWRETGGPDVTAPTRKGFGSRLISRVLAADFDGKVTLDYAPNGLVCTLMSPVASVVSGEPAAQAGLKATL